VTQEKELLAVVRNRRIHRIVPDCGPAPVKGQTSFIKRWFGRRPQG
jgi:hypothetical protein